MEEGHYSHSLYRSGTEDGYGFYFPVRREVACPYILRAGLPEWCHDAASYITMPDINYIAAYQHTVCHGQIYPVHW